MVDVPTEPFILSGKLSTRLRSFCSTQGWQGSDLDRYASLLETGSLYGVKTDFESRATAADVKSARNQLESRAYGPTRVPIFNFLLQLAFLKPSKRTEYLAIARYLALEAKVPVDSMDLSGGTAFMPVPKSITDGCTAAHGIATPQDHSNEGKKKTETAFRYFIDKGGDINIADGDGVTAKKGAQLAFWLVPGLRPLIARAQASQNEPSGTRACASCAKEESGQDTPLKRCAKCHTTLYCSQECQKADWKKHKKLCADLAAPPVPSSPLPGSSSSSAPRPSTTGTPGRVKALVTTIDKPYHRLETKTWLHDRAQQDVYKLLIDTYRLRLEDMYNFEGETGEDSIYSGARDGRRGFRRFLRRVESRAGLPPPWWSAEKAAQCETVGQVQGGWSSLSVKVKKNDVVEHYDNPNMPMQLRMLGEQIYGRGPGGADGTAMRAQMVLMEKGGPEGGLMSMLSVNLP